MLASLLKLFVCINPLKVLFLKSSVFFFFDKTMVSWQDQNPVQSSLKENFPKTHLFQNNSGALQVGKLTRALQCWNQTLIA